MSALNGLFSRLGTCIRAEERALGGDYKLPGPDYVEYVFALLGNIITFQLYQLSSDQAQSTLQLKVSLSNLV
jgi:hypothetical protein